MSSAATATLRVDEYRFIRPLGPADRAVFLAHDRRLDRAVVLHLLPADPAARASLLQSARALARVAHPSLCRVHRIRETGESPCIVQSFERGARLDSLAKPLPDPQVRALGIALAGALAALHASGVAHGDVTAERVIVLPSGAPCLLGLRTARVNAGSQAIAEDVAALLALLVSLADGETRDALGRLIAAGSALSADALGRELEALGSGAQPASTAEGEGDAQQNPYQGLRAFDAAQARLFFGRQEEVAEILAQLASAPWVVVAAASGAGKSSLVRAGVAPSIGSLGERPRWDVVTMVPGPHPLSALAAALAPVLARPADALEASLRADPALAGRLARERKDRGLLLVVDQLEEAITLAEPAEREAFFAVLSRFGVLAPGVRVVFTLRSDFLDRLGSPGTRGTTATLARDLLRATFVLPPMGADALRLAIVGPARARGFDFETPAMVDALVAEARTETGDALPLLSFALAELWTERDRDRCVLPEAALKRLGGAAAALARHGDTVLSTLTAPERLAARAVLVALVTAEGTRARRTREELVGDRGAPAEQALEALVRGRLVVAGESYEIAHEALVRAWPRLRGWLDEASDGRAAARRLATAAAEWDRLGRDAALLWGERQVRDLEAPGALAGASEVARAFAEASRSGVRRARRQRIALAVAAPVLLALVAGTAWGVSRARHRASVAAAVEVARGLEAKAAESARAAEARRAEALATFEKDDLGPAEKLWKETLALEDETDRQRREVGAAVGRALALEPGDAAARALAADVTLDRILAAERRHEKTRFEALRAELGIDDDGARAARLAAPGHVTVTTDPPGAALTLSRYVEDSEGRLVERDAAPLPAGERRELPQGSYLVVAHADGRYPTRYPFLLRRGEESSLQVVLPRTEDVPDGMVYVPAGRTLYGSGDDENTRNFYTHQPSHDVDVGAFLIAKTEVTNAEYLAFLASLPQAERKARIPGGLRLLPDGRIAARLRGKTLAPGEPYCSGAEPCADWSRLPVNGANRNDAEQLAAWLARSGRLPGARLCTDREWERAARGADDRQYPNGNRELGPDDACSLATYGGDASRAGPCTPGTHPTSRSPFGVDDLAGSESEWTSGPPDVAQAAQGTPRSGAYDAFSLYLAISNRGLQGSGARYAGYGIRLCSDVK